MSTNTAGVLPLLVSVPLTTIRAFVPGVTVIALVETATVVVACVAGVA